MNKMLSSVLIATCLFGVVYSYGTGAPVKACPLLAPMHTGINPQTTTSPYTIIVSKTNWENSGTLSVAICGGKIGGFILQAKQTNGEGIGTFEATPVDTNIFQLGPCGSNGTMISVTHTNPKAKNNLVFTWTAPNITDYNGDIKFQGAVAQNHDIFWTNVMSKNIQQGNSGDADFMATPEDTLCSMVTTTGSLPTTTNASTSFTPSLIMLICGFLAYLAE